MTGFALSARACQRLVARYLADGEVEVPEARLPRGCTPDRAPVLFLATVHGCDVFLPAAIAYHGTARFWQQVFLTAPVAGSAYLVVSEPRGIEAALAWYQHMVETDGAGVGNGPGNDLTDYAAVERALSARRAARPTVNPAALQRALAEEVRGQDQALAVIAQKVCRHRARVAPSRPASLLLVGPTGVGKTESARQLARALGQATAREWRDEPGRGDETTVPFLRLDMNEYAERHRVSSLLGAPPGYIGHGETSPLVEILRAHPDPVILFDEIDKAHADILPVLMNLLDAGRLAHHSGKGTERELDARRATLVFTSNRGAAEMVAQVEARSVWNDQRAIEDLCRRVLKNHGLAPELVGRFGAVVFFRDLPQATLAEVVALGIKRVAAEYGLTVVYIHPQAIVAVLEAVAGAEFGARLYHYAIEDILGASLLGGSQADLAEVVIGPGPEYAVLPAALPIRARDGRPGGNFREETN